MLTGSMHATATEKLVRNTPPGGKHLPAKGAIQISGDRARGDSAYRHTAANGVEGSGRYQDDFVRTPGGWRFARRTILPAS
jgi:hypothetical protein